MATSISEDGFSDSAEVVSDAQLLPRDEVLARVEQLVLELLGSVSEGTDPQLLMVDNNTLCNIDTIALLCRSTELRRMWSEILTDMSI